MRAREFTTEARRNPAQNPKVPPIERVEQRVQRNPNSTFVSMTAIDKLGINPRSQYSTPLGIYAYPAEYVLEHATESLEDLPFAGSQPFANIFNARGNIVDLSAMTEQEYQQWTHKISDYLANLWKTKLVHKYASPDEAWKAGADVVDAIVSNAVYEAKVSGRPGGKFWYVTMQVANMIADRLAANGSRSVAWNTVFRDLGIDGCVDHGVGIIHTSERNQAVFFHSRAIINVERVLNKWDNLSLKVGAESKVISSVRKIILDWVAQNPSKVGYLVQELAENFLRGEEYPIRDRIAAKIQTLFDQHGITWDATGYLSSVAFTRVNTPNGFTQTLWHLLSKVKTIPVEAGYAAFIRWGRRSSGLPKEEMLIGRFAQPDFIQYIKDKVTDENTPLYERNIILTSLISTNFLDGNVVIKMLRQGTTPPVGVIDTVAYTLTDSELDEIVEMALDDNEAATNILYSLPLTAETAMPILVSDNEYLLHQVRRNETNRDLSVAAWLIRQSLAKEPEFENIDRLVTNVAESPDEVAKILRAVTKERPDHKQLAAWADRVLGSK